MDQARIGAPQCAVLLPLRMIIERVSANPDEATCHHFGPAAFRLGSISTAPRLLVPFLPRLPGMTSTAGSVQALDARPEACRPVQRCSRLGLGHQPAGLAGKADGARAARARLRGWRATTSSACSPGRGDAPAVKPPARDRRFEVACGCTGRSTCSIILPALRAMVGRPRTACSGRRASTRSSFRSPPGSCSTSLHPATTSSPTRWRCKGPCRRRAEPRARRDERHRHAAPGGPDAAAGRGEVRRLAATPPATPGKVVLQEPADRADPVLAGDDPSSAPSRSSSSRPGS